MASTIANQLWRAFLYLLKLLWDFWVLTVILAVGGLVGSWYLGHRAIYSPFAWVLGGVGLTLFTLLIIASIVMRVRKPLILDGPIRIKLPDTTPQGEALKASIKELEAKLDAMDWTKEPLLTIPWQEMCLAYTRGAT